MRQIRTPSEQQAIAALCAILRNNGDTVEELPEYTDRPDAAIRFSGCIVAVECRTFTPERLLRLHGMDWPEGKPFQIYIPLEPHVWIREAIEAKAAKVPEYLARCGASSAWLILHSARGVFGHLSRNFEGGLSDLFHIGVWSFPHPFERIYLTGEDNLPPVCIFRTEDEQKLREKYANMRIKCIPIERHYIGQVTATAAPNGEGQITLDFNQVIERNILLQPLDIRFRADYSEIAKVTNAFVAQRTLPSLIYAEPVTPANLGNV